MDATRAIYGGGLVDRPAVYGGKPIFKEMVNIIRPTLSGLNEMGAELNEIFSSGSVTASKYVKLFEGECARYLGVKEAVAVSSATSGLILAVKGLGLKGEVIVPSFTFTATVHSLVWNGIKPVFVDCEEGTYNIDVTKISERITSRTSAIMPVYIFGNPPRIEELGEIAKKNNLKLIFDSAQAFGAEYQGVRAGGFGDCEIFSLSPTKVLTAIEGGLITTNDRKLSEFLRKSRDYGKSGEDIDYVGLSARMSELHALVGLKNLKTVDKCIETRIRLIDLYKRLLGPLEGISYQKVLPADKTSGNYMVLFIDDKRFGMVRDELYKALKAENIQTKKYFYPAVHKQKAYFQLGLEYEGKLPITEKAAQQGLALPLYGHMDPQEVKKVCLAIIRIYNYLQEKKSRLSVGYSTQEVASSTISKKMNKYRRGFRENLVFASDIFVIIFCYITAYFIRFDGLPPEKYFNMMLRLLPWVFAVRILALIYFKVHRSVWEYASIKDLTQILKAVSISSMLIMLGVMGIQVGHPRSIFIIDWLLLIISISAVRFFIRITKPIRWRLRNGNGHRRKVLIVGAGDAGEMILREMIYRYSHNYDVVGLIDDNPKKYGKRIHGVPVLGARLDIPDIVKRENIEEVIIAISSLKSETMRDIVNYCVKSGAKYRTVPNISDLVDGTVKVKELREVRLEDLLRRDEILLDRQRIESYIKGKNVLITGAGGSIGSELCKQVAKLAPRELILFEKSENTLFYIDMDLGQSFGDLRKVPVVGNMCDRKRVVEAFAQYKPQIIFHAAAYKHVSLMEVNSTEAIKNNVFGTKVIAEEAIKFGVEKFIMLSTDKAVDPTSLMGVSKKVGEMYISALAKINATKFMAVRFGNVLGSDGSVIPTFKKQIEKGGPVTITHPEIKRYFMTIPEAAGLVIEAGYMGQGGEIFILEMERQIKIVDLAKDLITLSGLEPNKDIEIVFTGLRAGEKMYESLVAEDEKLIKTSHEKILIVEPRKENKRNIFEDIKALEEIVDRGDMNALLEKLKEIVPTYKPSPHLLRIPQKQESSGKEKQIDILIVDDDKMIQSLLHKFFEGRGYNAFLASNGREALDIVSSNDLQIAIVDIRIPGFMNGIQILKNIKIINKNIEVIIITGFGTEKTRKLCNELGAYAYLEKPFDLLDIKKNVYSALSKQGIFAG